MNSGLKVQLKGTFSGDWTLTLGSTIVPFLFGILFITMIHGMPIDANGNFHAGFFDYVNIFSVVGGVAVTLFSYLHGLNYIALKTVGAIRDRAKNYAKFLYWVLYLGLVVFALLLIFQTDFLNVHPVGTLAFLVLIVLICSIGPRRRIQR